MTSALTRKIISIFGFRFAVTFAISFIVACIAVFILFIVPLFDLQNSPALVEITKDDKQVPHVGVLPFAQSTSSDAPKIRLNGDNKITLNYLAQYVDAGAVAFDSNGKQIKVTTTGEVNTGHLGQYPITYMATDMAGKTASLTKVVTIADLEAPVISLNGSATHTMFLGETYQELGVEVSDNYDEQLTPTITGLVDTTLIGTYYITYQVMDSSGNATSIIRTIHVNDHLDDRHSQSRIQTQTQTHSQISNELDKFQEFNPDTQIKNTNEIADLPPVITIIGSANVNAYLGKPYTDLGARAFDHEDGVLDVTTLGFVDTQILGEYQLIYVATDSLNQRVELTRTVNVLPNKFITLWKTNNEGVSADNQITLEVNKTHKYDFSVEWGDGKTDTHINTNITHTYAKPGEYQIVISGDYPAPYFSGSAKSDAKKLLSVQNWGDNRWKSMYRAFYGCENMQLNASDAPDLSLVENMNHMFASAHKFNQAIGHWDVSNVKSMSRMFFIASSFNQDISRWNVSNVENMESMFRFAGKFNQDISNWNVSKVKNMSGMFLEADQFNQDINRWNMTSVKRLDYMFAGTDQFNQALDDWNIESVENLSGMFSGAKAFNQDLNRWDVTGVKNMSSMFQSTERFNGNISDWQLNEVTSLSSMFRATQSFNRDITRWNVSGVTDMKSMFKDAVSFNQDLSFWDISNVTDMSEMFTGMALSTNYYDALLLSWADQIPQEHVTFDAGDSQYTKESLAQTARNTLIDTFGWTIQDAGFVVPVQ